MTIISSIHEGKYGFRFPIKIKQSLFIGGRKTSLMSAKRKWDEKQSIYPCRKDSNYSMRFQILRTNYSMNIFISMINISGNNNNHLLPMKIRHAIHRWVLSSSSYSLMEVYQIVIINKRKIRLLQMKYVVCAIYLSQIDRWRMKEHYWWKMMFGF